MRQRVLLCFQTRRDFPPLEPKAGEPLGYYRNHRSHRVHPGSILELGYSGTKRLPSPNGAFPDSYGRDLSNATLLGTVTLLGVDTLLGVEQSG